MRFRIACLSLHDRSGLFADRRVGLLQADKPVRCVRLELGSSARFVRSRSLPLSPDNTRFYPDPVRHLCAARDLEHARQHTRLSRSCPTCPTTQAFTPILFDIYVLRETWSMPDNTGVYPDLVRYLCAARDLEHARQHPRLPRSCSTSMCCERLRACPTTYVFTPILFDIYVLRET